MNIKILFMLSLTVSLLFINIDVAYSQFTKTVVAVTGNVINYNTKLPESIQITVFDNAGKKINSVKSNAAEGGYYYVTGLYPGNTYIFVVKEKNFLTERFEVSVPNSDKYLEISKDFLIKPNASGTAIKLAVSPFELKKSKLRYGSSVILNDVLNTVKYNPNVKFTVVSYPDGNDNTAANLELTAKRSESLIDYFSVNGIDPDNLTVKGTPNTDPKSPLPSQKAAKGKRYIGSVYIIIN